MNDFYAVVVAADRANAVRTLCGTAMVASSESRHFDLPVRTTLVTTGSRGFSFWCCHF